MAGPVILAWQLGGGRGHVGSLIEVARALPPGLEIDAALRSLDHAADLARLCRHVYPCAALGGMPPDRPSGPSASTWANFLGDSGLVDPAYLTACFAWWHQTFSARKPSLVVCDYAPVAQWTARSMGIPVVSVGIALGQPPPDLNAFPLLLDDHDGWRYDETVLAANVNIATRGLGFAPLQRLPQLHEADDQVLMSFPVLDPYRQAVSGRVHISPVSEMDDAFIDTSGGDEVFVYFSTTETLNKGLMDAVETLDLPVRAYLPAAQSDCVSRLRAAGVTVLDAPADAAAIKRRSRLLLHAGQHGILSLGMALGLAQFAVPQQLEQLFNAREAAAVGGTSLPVRTGIGAEEFRSNMRDAYFSDDLSKAALRQRDIVRPTVKAGLRDALQRVLTRHLAP